MNTIRNDAVTARLSNGDLRVAAATVGKLSVFFRTGWKAES
jgi:hypothetical protein